MPRDVSRVCRGTIPPHQCVRLLLEANPWHDGVGSQETLDFLSEQLGSVLRGEDVKSSDPPSIDLLCTHISKVNLVLFLQFRRVIKQ